MFSKCRAILQDGNVPLMHSCNYEISSIVRRAETRRARNSDGKSLLFQRNSLCPKERCKKSWVADLTNYCQSHSSHSAASFPSNCEMGAYIRRTGVPVDRHFPSKTPSHWNIGGLAVLAVYTYQFYDESSWYAIFLAKWYSIWSTRQLFP